MGSEWVNEKEEDMVAKAEIDDSLEKAERELN